MQTFFFKYLRLIIPSFLLYFSFFLPPARAEAPKKILILPFELHAQKDLAYIKEGIFDMLAARLGRESRIEVIPKDLSRNAMEGITSPVTAKNAAALGEKVKADYIIFGSITLFGESISTDARVVAAASGQTALQFDRTGSSRNDLIGHIDAFATQIKSELLGQPAPKEAQGAPSQNNPPTLPEQETNALPAQRRISQKINMEIRALAVGDVNGDKLQEIVVIGQTAIAIYRSMEKGLQRIGEIKEKRYNNFLSVAAADMNNNGRAEIFVTNLPYSSDRLQSFVLEYNGTDYARVAEKERYFFRTLQGPDGAKELIGQKYDHIINTMGINQLYEGPVFKVTWEQGRYLPGDAVHLPGEADIFNFAQGDLLHNGKKMTLLYNSSNVPKVLTASGTEEWRGEESFGSRATYLELPDNQKVNKIMDRHYLPTRILPIDANRDGRLDVLVIKNKESASSIKRVKIFKNGRIACLSWDGLNFQPLWQSETVSKHISDFTVADLTGKGRREIIYAVVAKEKGSFKEGQSYIVRQPITKSMFK